MKASKRHDTPLGILPSSAGVLEAMSKTRGVDPGEWRVRRSWVIVRLEVEVLYLSGVV